MSSVLDLLQSFLVIHLRVKLTILIYIILVLDFLMVGELGHRSLMLLLELCQLRVVSCLRGFLLILRALAYRLIVFFVKMLFDVVFSVCNQLRDLILILGLDLFCLGKLSLKLCYGSFVFCLAAALVSLQRIDSVLKGHYPVCAVHSQGIDLFLYAAHIIVNRLAQFHFPLGRKNLFISCCHIYRSPSL